MYTIYIHTYLGLQHSPQCNHPVSQVLSLHHFLQCSLRRIPQHSQVNSHLPRQLYNQVDNLQVSQHHNQVDNLLGVLQHNLLGLLQRNQAVNQLDVQPHNLLHDLLLNQVDNLQLFQQCNQRDNLHRILLNLPLNHQYNLLPLPQNNQHLNHLWSQPGSLRLAQLCSHRRNHRWNQLHSLHRRHQVSLQVSLR